jgi:hypothetical protein
METQMGENHKMFFYILEDYIHKKHKLSKLSITNWKVAPTPFL